jgi:hypothetical protein
VVAVEALGAEQEGAELGTAHAATLTRLHLGSTHILGWIRRNAAIDVSEPVEAAHRRKASIDRRRREAAFLHRGAVQLDVRPSGFQDDQMVVGCPLEEPA